jgi:hypothetical protein
MNILLITIGVILWLLIGFISVKIQVICCYVYWYKTFNKHYVDSEHYISDHDFIAICTLSGLISTIVILPDLLNKEGMCYYKNSLYMIFYNKQKVENHFKNKQ